MSDADMPTEQSEKTAGLPSQGATTVDQQQSLIAQPEPEHSQQSQPDLPMPTTERPSLWTRIQESWIAEFVALIVAAGAIAAIVILLSEYDRTELPSWNGVTLNSLVSWLNTAAGICMAYVAGMTIAQLKWVWFAQQARNIEDMRLFNGAGGVWGAVQLLVRLRLRHFTVVTLLAIIFAMGLDPFSQNLIGFYDNNVVDVDQVSIVTRSRWYDTMGPETSANQNGTNPILKVNIDSAIATLGRSTNSSLPNFICNTGNCTYPPFATLAYQAACTDVSDRIKVNCTAISSSDADTKCEYHLDTVKSDSDFKLYYYKKSSGSPVLMKSRVASNAEDYMVYNRTGANKDSKKVFQFLRVDVNPYFQDASSVLNSTVAVVAQECIIMPCVQSIEASVRRGIYTEKVLDTYTESNASIEDVVMRPPWGPDKGIQSDDDNKFGISWEVTSGDDYLDTALDGILTMNDGNRGYKFTTDQLQNIWFANVSALETCPFTSQGKKDPFACAIKASADAYTQTVRDAVYTVNGAASPEGFARGETLVSRTFIRVKWRWIALHVVVWVLTTVGWVGTVLRTKSLGIPFWRGDPMPMVYMYSDAQRLSQQSAAESRSSLWIGMSKEMGGDDVMMRLLNEDGHMRLVREE